MLPILIPLAIAGGSVLLAKFRARAEESDGVGGNEKQLPADGDTWAPGEVPGAPWQADRSAPNGGDCGINGENVNAHMARYMNRRWKIPLPGPIMTWSSSKLAGWLASWAQHQGPSRPDVVADLDALQYGCIGKRFVAGVKEAPAKVGGFLSQNYKAIAGDISGGAKSAVDQVSDAVNDAGDSISETATNIVKGGWHL